MTMEPIDAVLPAGTSDAALQPAAELEGRARWDFLKREALFGASWTLVGRIASNGLRVAANLILTRILFPEAFGLMALINVFMIGLQLLSDIGITQAVMQSRRGSEPEFLDTAWTMQILRGGSLWLGSVIIAWPVSLIYERADLKYLLPATAVTLIVGGFNSTAILKLNRELKLGKVIGLDLFSQIVTLATTIALALWTRSVWSLVLGGVLGSVAKMVTSHFLVEDYRSHLRLEPAASRELIRFGRWIFLGSALGFVLGQAEQLVLGRVDPTMSVLAFYAIAQFLPNAIIDYLSSLSSGVLLPLYARLSVMEPEVFFKKTLRVRAWLCCVSCVPLCVLTVAGPELIRLLYDHRYASAGPFLQFLAAGSIATSICLTASGALMLALGDSFRHMLLVFSGAVLKYAAMFVGYKFDGVRGLVIGSTFSVVLNYPFIALVVRKHRMWQPMFDLGAALASAALIVVGFGLKALVRSLIGP